ncbi:hypothetical protein Aoki45_33190 [Algoriphagus sp. oki45]|uniref:hypothetical protein n=1 Tax=Algoriphagus sp. oki45 TaxID=3067294 RepID=UPI0027F909B5|nr:hypothetical protein Aoki45_33190 [Algoriphagus sp. oki45]
MGFNIKTTELLIQSKKLGIDFSKVVTIGRQQMNGSFIQFEEFFKKIGLRADEFYKILTRENRYSEGFLRWLGADRIDSIDASSYESATIIHDMNLPIDTSLYQSHSVVIDSGSLEHIFNFPQAIQNCMEMVELGGHMIGVTPSNNFLGHGFYQFSPELIYRVFSPENGFQIKKMWLFFPYHESPVYEVSDPAQVQDRVKFKNSEETFLFYIAERQSVKRIFEKIPQQSDYENILWEDGEDQKEKKKKKKSGLKIFIPDFLILKLLNLRKTYLNFKSKRSPIGNGNPKYFKRVKF